MTGTLDPLSPRLFGYATLFRARPGARGYEALDSDPLEEAAALAATLAGHVGLPGPAGARSLSGAGEWGVSVPFGRCGLEGRPQEHVRVFGAAEAWCDHLGADGSVSRTPLAEGEIFTFTPGGIQRLVARAPEGRRALVAFQTEDRTPLMGHAAAWSGDQDIPEDTGARVEVTNRAFDELAGAGESVIAAAVGSFMQDMSGRLVADPAVARERQIAAAAGSYAAGPDEGLFQRQRELVTTDVLAEIAAAAEGRFRFPGMFGAVAPLFDLV